MFEKENDELYNGMSRLKRQQEQDIAKRDIDMNGLTKNNFDLYNNYGKDLHGADFARYNNIRDSLP